MKRSIVRLYIRLPRELLAFLLSLLLGPAMASAEAPLVTLADASARTKNGLAVHENQRIRVRGVVSVDGDVFLPRAQKTFIQDDSGGLALFDRKSRSRLRGGDEVTVEGTIKTFAGAPEMVVETIQLHRRGVALRPIEVAAEAMLSRRFYGRLVRTQGKVIDVIRRPTGMTVVLPAGENVLRVYITARQAAAFSAVEFEKDSVIAVTGVASQYDRSPPFTEGWQLLPRAAADIQLVRPAPRFTRNEVRGGIAVAAAILLVSLGWNVLLRREYGKRKRAEEYVRSVVENVSDLIMILHGDGTIRYQSPAAERLFGWTPEERPGRQALDLVHPDDRAHVQRQLSQTWETLGATTRAEFRVQHRDGTWRHVEAVAVNMTENRSVRGILVDWRDITERTLLSKQLGDGVRMASLGHLAATIAHEFNNVLMGIQPFVEVIQRHAGHEARIESATRHITSSIARGKNIAQGILRFTRFDEPVPTPLDVGRLLNELTIEARSLLPREIDLEILPPAHSLHIRVDAGQVHQAFINLVLNARDAMPAGGKLTLEARREPPAARFSFGIVDKHEEFVHFLVRDNGTGISPDILAHIFEPLFTTKRSGGTGLGLAVVHQTVLQNQGKLFVESTPGSGTTFHLFLPLTEARAEPGETTEKPTPRPNRRVLVVEDDEIVGIGISSLLELEGMEVHLAARGSEVMAAIESWMPDVVVLDVGLPDMDGTEVYGLIAGRWPDLAVIFSSGHADQEKVLQASHSNVAFLLKPYDSEMLLDAMHRLLRPAVNEPFPVEPPEPLLHPELDARESR